MNTSHAYGSLAPMKLDAFYLLPQSGRMIPVCPKCDTGLFILKFKSVAVDYCERCRGVWLDTGELEQLAGASGESLFALEDQTGVVPAGKKHLCPRCDAPLEEFNAQTNLTLDRCPSGHGLWFDADELTQLLALAHADKTAAYLNDIFGKTVNI